MAWLFYVSWIKYKDARYKDAALKCLDFLQHREAKEGPYYEIMLPYGAYLAVRMNAELGTKYDELKIESFAKGLVFSFSDFSCIF